MNQDATTAKQQQKVLSDFSDEINRATTPIMAALSGLYCHLIHWKEGVYHAEMETTFSEYQEKARAALTQLKEKADEIMNYVDSLEE